MEKTFIQKLISFLLGLSWGTAFFSFIAVFGSYYDSHGFFAALILAVLAFLFVMLFVVLFEYMNFKVTSSLRIEKKLDKLAALMEHDKLSDH